MPGNDPEIRIGVSADTKEAENGLDRVKKSAGQIGSEARTAGDAGGKALGAIGSAASAASGSVMGVVSGARGLAAALGSLSGGIALAGLIAAAKLAYDLWQNMKKAKEEAARIQLGNLGSRRDTIDWAASREREGIESADHAAGLSAGVRDARAAAELEAARARLAAERETALAGAGGDASAAARVNADFELRAAELAARAAAEASARAVADMRSKSGSNAATAAAARAEFADLAEAQRQAIRLSMSGDADDETRRGASEQADAMGQRMMALKAEIERLESENRALAERMAIEESRSGARDATLEAARIRRDRTVAGLDAAAAETGAAPEAARHSPLSVASDAMRRIGAEAGGTVSPVPQKLDLMARIAQESRELMRRIEENTRSPIATFA